MVAIEKPNVIPAMKEYKKRYFSLRCFLRGIIATNGSKTTSKM